MSCNMLKNIQFTTVVQTCCKKDGKFEVTSLELKTQKVTTRMFDHVVVATGHYTTPNFPNFKGLDLLRKTKVLHSHDFKVPTQYKDKNVFVLGGSYSAEDLASMVWKFGAKHIYISSRSKFNPYEGWPSNVSFHAGLTECKVTHDAANHDTTESLILSDGTELKDIDAMLICTGYQYNFRFIDNPIRLVTNHWLITENLYKGMFLTSDPDIMYLGMQDQIISFTMMDCQAWAAMYYITGKI